jgi:hypothetical protein
MPSLALKQFPGNHHAAAKWPFALGPEIQQSNPPAHVIHN